MWSDIKEVFGRSARYAWLCPLLFMLPVAIEMIQHVVEIAGGMYDSREGMIAAGSDPLRLAIGHLKVLALFAIGYWAARFVVFGDDPAAARRLDPRALLLFVPVMAWNLLWMLLLLDGPLVARAMGIAEASALSAMLIVTALTMLFEPLLHAWKTAAAAGNPAIGFVTSIRIVAPVWLRAQGLWLMTVLPLMVAHYGLAVAAVGAPRELVWALMIADSVLVGFLGVVMVAGAFVIARRAADRAGLPLRPDPAPLDRVALA